MNHEQNKQSRGETNVRRLPKIAANLSADLFCSLKLWILTQHVVSTWALWHNNDFSFHTKYDNSKRTQLSSPSLVWPPLTGGSAPLRIPFQNTWLFCRHVAGLRRSRSIWPKHIKGGRPRIFRVRVRTETLNIIRKSPLMWGCWPPAQILSERRFFHDCDAKSVDLTGDDEAKFL